MYIVLTAYDDEKAICKIKQFPFEAVSVSKYDEKSPSTAFAGTFVEYVSGLVSVAVLASSVNPGLNYLIAFAVDTPIAYIWDRPLFLPRFPTATSFVQIDFLKFAAFLNLC